MLSVFFAVRAYMTLKPTILHWESKKVHPWDLLASTPQTESICVRLYLTSHVTLSKSPKTVDLHVLNV